LVGRRYVLRRRRPLPLLCSSTSARTSSHAHRPTSTLTSRSCDQPSSTSIVVTARDFLSQSVICVSTRAVVVHVSLQYRSSLTLPQISSRARQASRSFGRGPRLVCGLPTGCVTSGGERMPRI